MSNDGNEDIDWPDYSPLYNIVKEGDGMLALDFSARVGARPYFTYEDGEWRGVSVGPFDSTEDGTTVITTKEMEADEQEIIEMLHGARVVQLRATQDTPLEEYEDWVYGPVDEQEDSA